MSNAINALTQNEVQTQDQTEENPLVQTTAQDGTYDKIEIADGVQVKVANSRKCISVYGVAPRGQVVNFTLEQFELLDSAWGSLQDFVKTNRDMIMSREERNAEFKSTKTDKKVLEKHGKLQENVANLEALQAIMTLQKMGIDLSKLIGK